MYLPTGITSHPRLLPARQTQILKPLIALRAAKGVPTEQMPNICDVLRTETRHHPTSPSLEELKPFSSFSHTESQHRVAMICHMYTYVDDIWWGFPPNTDVKTKELELLAKHYNSFDLGLSLSP